MPKYKIMIGRFPYGNEEDSRCVDWLMKAAVQLSKDPRFELSVAKIADTPITMTRNMMIEHALAKGVDYLLIVDADVEPDCELGEDPAAKPFLQSSVEFALAHHGPCVVAAPYCGPPPFENVYVFQWGNKMSEDPDHHGSIDQFTREHAAMMTGITEVGALPTGLMLIDMRAFKGIKPPYTYYEWKNEGPPCPHCGCKKPGPQSEKASTEDVTLTRDLNLAGVKMYCNWDAWAAHIKKKRVRKPRPWTTDMIQERMREAIVRNVHAGDRIVQVTSNRFEADIAAAVAAGPAKNFPDAASPAAPAAGPDAPIRAATIFGTTALVGTTTPLQAAVFNGLTAGPLPDLAREETRPAGVPLTMDDILGTL